MLPQPMMDLLRQRLGDRLDECLIPPPVFHTMRGRFTAFDLGSGLLVARFPVLEGYRNPYGSMQGGMIAAAIDNTIGPLSMLVAPPNVTRRLQVTYSHPVTPDLEYITVEGRFIGREGRRLEFLARVRDPQGVLLTRARATHWVLDEIPGSE